MDNEIVRIRFVKERFHRKIGNVVLFHTRKAKALIEAGFAELLDDIPLPKAETMDLPPVAETAEIRPTRRRRRVHAEP